MTSSSRFAVVPRWSMRDDAGLPVATRIQLEATVGDLDAFLHTPDAQAMPVTLVQELRAAGHDVPRIVGL